MSTKIDFGIACKAISKWNELPTRQYTQADSVIMLKLQRQGKKVSKKYPKMKMKKTGKHNQACLFYIP